jgi:hypothetical protein
MVDPSLSFNPLSTNFGSIDVGTSCAYQSYHIKNKAATATARNMSVYILKSIVGVSEFIVESWAYYSTVSEKTRVGGSVSGASWCQVPSVAGGASVVVKHKLIVPSDASSSGRQPFFGKHKYQFT